jgi:antitoxin component YwqK of YwqJK toxin-antitoxin module
MKKLNTAVIATILITNHCLLDDKSLDCPWFTSQFQHKEPGIEIQYCAKNDNNLEIHHGPRKLWINGKLSSFDHWKNNKKHGNSKEWYPDGNIKLQGKYNNGKEEGKWFSWHPNGNKRSEGLFVSGMREGIWMTWHANGKTEEKAFYKDGKKDGKWTSWYPNGNKRQEGGFVSGIKRGKWITWYGDGNSKMEEVEYKMGAPVSSPSRYSPSGEQILTGGVGRFKDGRREGEWIFYYPSGKERMRAEYSDNRLNGKLISWQENGLKDKEETYHLDKKDGPAIYYFADGRIKANGVYKNDKRDGVWKTLNRFGEQSLELFKENIPIPMPVPGNVNLRYFVDKSVAINGANYVINDGQDSDQTMPITITRQKPHPTVIWKLAMPETNTMSVSSNWSFLVFDGNNPIAAISNGFGWEQESVDKYSFFSLGKEKTVFLGSLEMSYRQEWETDDLTIKDKYMNRSILQIERADKGIMIRTRRVECEEDCNKSKRIFLDDYLLSNEFFKKDKSIQKSISE